jgi:hypothetical protein
MADQMIVDFLVYLICFLLPALDLYGALTLRDLREMTRAALPLLRHFIVAVAVRALTSGLDVILGSMLIYEFAKLVCALALVYGKHYDGSAFVFRRFIRPLADQFPMVVGFAGQSHEASMSQDAQFLIRAFAEKFRAEYERILGEIDD